VADVEEADPDAERGDPNEVKSHYMKRELEDPTDKISTVFPSEIPDGSINVLVVEPAGTRKRTRVEDWFADDGFSVHLKKHKVDESQPDQTTRYFNVARFPPLAHPMQKYSKIVERDAYAVIFAELMRKVKLWFDAGSGANMVVTGNPGTGKSRFYLYCIFRVLSGCQAELATFDLVLNCNDEFHKYAAETKDFIELDAEDVRALRHQGRVLRLVEGNSSELTGCDGVSILFASPGLTGMTNYAKVDSFTYILPVWTFEELQDYNVLLDDGLKLAEDVLISRYDEFGGIPRFIFTSTEPEDGEELSKAISTFSALDIISYAKSNHPVRDGNYSHRVLKMVPTLEIFRAKFHLDFLSKYIAEQIVSRVTEESIQKVSEFAIAHADDDSGSTSVVRGKIYEMLCHRWFSLHKQRTLQLRPLSSGGIWDIFWGEMPTERFSSLDEIKPPKKWTYRPTSKTFGAVDAFVILGNDCIGLQMTLNQNHGIKVAPLNTFLEWLKGVGIAEDQFHFAFVVPSHLVGSFKKQTIRTTTNSVTKKSGATATVKQYVAPLDVLVGDN